jgi:hypothetical protein
MEYLTKVNYFSVSTKGHNIVIGETSIDGQNRDVWCNSKKPITDLNMYLTAAHFTDPLLAITPSCYVLNNNVGVKIVMYKRTGSECLSSGTIMADYVLCE